MRNEVTATGKTIDAAVAAGADMLGTDAANVTYEVLEMPKKGFFGIGEAPAKVKVIYEVTPQQIALSFLTTVLSDMELDASAAITASNDEEHEYQIEISGPDASQLIGHHGETLDSLQYLANLSANKREEDGSRTYTRITLDIEGYREKRAETLRELARRMAGKVLKYRKSISLEPMNSYERRIIHSEIQQMEGVSTSSVGADDNRRVVIFLADQNGAPADSSARRGGDRSRPGSGSYRKPYRRHDSRKPDNASPADSVSAETYEPEEASDSAASFDNASSDTEI